MMLSTVAERMYWAARYLERTENTARLVGVYDNLLLDLPQGIEITWYNLVALNGLTENFAAHYASRDEHSVVNFLLADDRNPVSMLSSLRLLRENVRTTRDVLSPLAWEFVNELHLLAIGNFGAAGDLRGRRHRLLDDIIKGCVQISGLLNDAISHDAGWQFIQLGRHLERADMITRILDAGAVLLLQPSTGQGVNLPQIVWGHVLRSLGADQGYRRTVRAKVAGVDVTRFLLEDEYFPRTLRFCHDRLADAIDRLPNRKAARECLALVGQAPLALDGEDDLGEPLREYLNDLQIRLAGLHQCFVESWFSFA